MLNQSGKITELAGNFAQQSFGKRPDKHALKPLNNQIRNCGIKMNAFRYFKLL